MRENAFSFSRACCLGPVATVHGASRVPKCLIKCITFKENDLKSGLIGLPAVLESFMSNSQLLSIFIYPSVSISLL